VSFNCLSCSYIDWAGVSINYLIKIYGGNKMAKKPTKVVDPGVTLGDIVEATLAGTIIYTFKEEYEPLVASGMVEINPAMSDPDNVEAIATRATQAGIDFISSGAVTAPVIPVKKEKLTFEIEDGVAIPENGARSGRETVYPFDKLEVGQSIFIANSEAKPDAAKSIASTISSTHARFSIPDPSGKTRIVMKGEKKGEIVPVMIKTRTFTVRTDEKGGVKGARVWRTA
jgi:hypothetical protein